MLDMGVPRSDRRSTAGTLPAEMLSFGGTGSMSSYTRRSRQAFPPARASPLIRWKPVLWLRNRSRDGSLPMIMVWAWWAYWSRTALGSNPRPNACCPFRARVRPKPRLDLAKPSSGSTWRQRRARSVPQTPAPTAARSSGRIMLKSDVTFAVTVYAETVNARKARGQIVQYDGQRACPHGRIMYMRDGTSFLASWRLRLLPTVPPATLHLRTLPARRRLHVAMAARAHHEAALWFVCVTSVYSHAVPAVGGDTSGATPPSGSTSSPNVSVLCTRVQETPQSLSEVLPLAASPTGISPTTG